MEINTNQYLSFTLTEQKYCLHILNTKEILDYSQPTVLPNNPSYVAGVINLRGESLPIIKLAQLLNKEHQVVKSACIIVLEMQLKNENKRVGIIVDKVNNTVDISDEQIRELPTLGSDQGFLNGVTTKDNEDLIVIDNEKLIASFNIQSNDTTSDEVESSDVEKFTSIQYLTFLLHDDVYCMDVMRTKEIIDYSQPVVVPFSPSYIAGVLNLRGNILPIINLHNRFKLSPFQKCRTSSIVVFDVNISGIQMEIGIIVDKVQDTIWADERYYIDVPEFGTQIPADFITSIIKKNNALSFILNFESILNLDDIKKSLSYE
jgi:purine-binding chemotaxis protein CheW